MKLFGMNAEHVMIAVIGIMAVMLIILIAVLCKQIKLNKQYAQFMNGKGAASLEDTLVKRINQVETLQVKVDAHTKDIEAIFEELTYTYQKIGLVKYDAFNEMGGKLSFALTLLDKENNGFLLNSMQSREGCYTYIKEILDGKSYIDLGTEEKQSLEKAISGCE